MGGKPSRPKITPQDRAILDLKIQRDKLKQYQKKVLTLWLVTNLQRRETENDGQSAYPLFFLCSFFPTCEHDICITQIQIILDREVEIAKEQLRLGNKKRALLALKKKKFQETLLQKTDAQLLNLEELTHSIEYALVEKDVLAGLKSGNEVLAAIHKEMSIEEVEKLMDDTTDAIAYQNEIDTLLSGSISAEDEEDILRELDGLAENEQKELEQKMPEVPKTEIPAIQTKEPSQAEVEQPILDDSSGVTPSKTKTKQKQPSATMIPA